jgi:hypothetical protein
MNIKLLIKTLSKVFLNIKSLYLLLFLLIITAIYLATSVLDPDFGWHLTMGNLIIKNGLPKNDPFSYTMPSYPFVDHEWLTNILIAKLYSVVHKLGLALIYTGIVLSALLITLKNTLSREGNRYFFKTRYLFLLILGMTGILPYFGVRPQVESWLLFALLLNLILNEFFWSRYWFLAALLILLWVNLHGSFAEGVIVSILIIVIRSFRKKKLIVTDIIAIFLILAASFLNPYGWRIWWETWMQFSDSSLRWTISEWLPVIFSYNFSFVIIVSLATFLIWKYRKRFYLEELFLYFILLIQGISSTRHVPLWIIAALPLLNISLGFLINEIKKISKGENRLILLSKYFILGMVCLLILETGILIYNAYSLKEENFYPYKAVEFLKTQNIKGNIFSNYNWGGYLIWNYPEKKVFIDGRMPSWRTDIEYQNESKSAMKDYLSILEKGKYETSFSKFNINYVLIPISKTRNDQNTNLIQQLKNFFYEKNNWEELDKKLNEAKWQVIYSDSTANLYQRP